MDPKFFGNLCLRKLWHICLQAHPSFQKSYKHTIPNPHNKHKTYPGIKNRQVKSRHISIKE